MDSEPEVLIPTVVPTATSPIWSRLIGWLYQWLPFRGFQTSPAYRWPVFLSLFILSGLALLQCSLVFGLPFGRAAWGGEVSALPWSLRIGSALAIFVYWVMVRVMLDRTSQDSRRVFRRRTLVGAWFFTVYLGANVVMNAMSRSAWEQWLMAPVAFILFVCFARLLPRPRLTEAMIHINS